MNTLRNITDLPLEVLGLIFKELPSLEHRLCLAQVHPHIGLAFSFHYGKTFKNLDLPVKKVSVLLPLCGSNVQHINGANLFDGTMWKLVELHCPNLQSIKITISPININSVKSFLAKVKSLRSLTLYVRCELRNHLVIAELLKFQSSLRRLRLIDFSSDQLLEVRKLVNLEELIIDGCLDNSLNIHELSYPLKKLETLYIDCRRFTASKEFDRVPCPALRELQLGKTGNWVFGILCPSTPVVLEWILSHAERLEILTLNIDITDYEPESVIYKILSECKHLRYFSMLMDEADTEFAHRVVKIVSENGVTSEERPLDLNFRNSEIHNAIQNVMVNTSAKQLITFKNFIVKNYVDV